MIHAQLKRFFHILWDTGNFWGRVFILSLVCWPLLLAAVAATGGNSTLTALLALIPFLTLVLGIAIYPVIDVAVLALEEGRGILKWIAAIIGVELVIGVYFSMVPLSNDSGLAPLLVLVIAAIILLSLSQKLKFIRFILWVTFIVLTLIFVVGGREKAKGLIPKMPGQQDAKQPPAPQGYMENGYWIPEEVLPVPKPKVESKTYRREMADGTVIEIVTNCQDNKLITTLEPGEAVEIRHVDHGPYDLGSYCSYGFDGKIAPINGHPERVARPRFEEDFFFPTDIIPPEATGFYMVDEHDKGLARDYIKKIGGKIYLYHPSHATGRATVYMQINLPQGEVAKKREQIGWNGATLHVFATKLKERSE